MSVRAEWQLVHKTMPSDGLIPKQLYNKVEYGSHGSCVYDRAQHHYQAQATIYTYIFIYSRCRYGR